MLNRISLSIALSTQASALIAQTEVNTPSRPKAWYDAISLRGYTQLRYNQIAVTNPKLVSEQGDRSIGGNNGFFLRRARLILTANPTEMVTVYIQPDLATTPVNGGASHFAQLRDLYADLFLTQDKSLRVRVGQSKVPYGFENLQSSQNRLPLDRNDALNSAVKDERDIGAFFYWAPPTIRERLKMLVDKGLKGSGDYGVIALGAYNGQTANQPEANRSLHVVSRVTYPLLVGGEQILETSFQGYTGRYVVKTSESVPGPKEILDQRIGASFIYFPQPFGIQWEYNWGVGPQYDVELKSVEAKNLQGGYLLLSYRQNHFTGFFRTQAFDGGRKHEVNAIAHKVRETEVGLEWQWDNALEVTLSYAKAQRTNPKKSGLEEEGQFGRVQLQWNY